MRRPRGDRCPVWTSPPRTEEIQLSFPLPEDGRCFLNLRFTLREPVDGLPAGSEAAFVQLPLPVSGHGAAPKPRPKGRVDCRWEGETLWLSGEGWRMAYDRQTALFRSWTVHGKALFRQPMTFQVWRAPTDNDQNVQAAWRGRDTTGCGRGYTVPPCGRGTAAASSKARSPWSPIKCSPP